MKKTLTRLILAGIFMAGTTAYGQVSGQKFSPNNSSPVSLAAQNGIKVSYLQGTIGTMPAICLGFKNTSSKEVVFNWTLKDAKGNVIHTGEDIKLEAGQSLDVDNNPILKNRLTFIVNNGMKAEDYKTEITIKN